MASDDPIGNDMTYEDKALAAGRKVLDIEIAALSALKASLGRDFTDAVEMLALAKGRIIVSGMGKSGHVARKIAATLASTGTPAFYIHPGEASHGDLGMVCPGDVVVALSRSGETGELGDLVSHAEAEGLVLIGISCVAKSALAERATHGLILPDVPEACAATRAPTTSTTMMMALGDALAVALLERKGFTADDFKRFHPGGRLGARLRTVADIMHQGDAMPRVVEGAPLGDVLSIMSEKGLGCVCVIAADGQLSGIVTDGDIRRLVGRGEIARSVTDIMTVNPITVGPTDMAYDTLILMNDRLISQIIVTEGTRPVGVVHMHDFLKAGIR